MMFDLLIDGKSFDSSVFLSAFSLAHLAAAFDHDCKDQSDNSPEKNDGEDVVFFLAIFVLAMLLIVAFFFIVMVLFFWSSMFWPSVFWSSMFWPSVFWSSVFWPAFFWIDVISNLLMRFLMRFLIFDSPMIRRHSWFEAPLELFWIRFFQGRAYAAFGRWRIPFRLLIINLKRFITINDDNLRILLNVSDWVIG